MAPARLSRLQHRILVWLLADAQRTRGTMSASHMELVQALAHGKGNLSHSLHNLEAKGLVTIARTPGGQAQAVDLTAEGHQQVVGLA
jgi:DNA-binding MarR family transcriptional regulator